MEISSLFKASPKVLIFDDFCFNIIGEFGVFGGDHFRFSILGLIGINLERDDWERNASDGRCKPVTFSVSVKMGK